MNKIKIIEAKSAEELDKNYEEYCNNADIIVFAGQFQPPVWDQNTKNFLYTICVFYSEKGTDTPKEPKEEQPEGMGSETAGLPAHKKSSEQTEFGAAWPDKDDSKMLNIKIKAGGYMKIKESDLIFQDGVTYYVDPDEEVKLYFEKTRSDKPKFPKYKVYT